MLESLFKKVADLFPCEYCEIFTNTYFEEHLPMVAFADTKAFVFEFFFYIFFQMSCTKWFLILIFDRFLFININDFCLKKKVQILMSS